MGEARLYPQHCIPHFVRQDSNERETRALVDLYLAKKAAKEGTKLPSKSTRDPPSSTPFAYAVKLRDEEEMKMKQIRDDVRHYVEEEELKTRKIDDITLRGLYVGISRHGEGRGRYLKERVRLIPELRHSYPVTTAFNYGWKVTGHLYNTKTFNLRSAITTSFYTRNGVPELEHGMCVVRQVLR